MSNARPHTPYRVAPTTPRQRRRFNRKVRTYQDVEVLQVLDHGGSGQPVRKPLLHTAVLPLDMGGSSFVTHVAYRCDPCKQHTRPRLHRVPRAVYFGVSQ